MTAHLKPVDSIKPRKRDAAAQATLARMVKESEGGIWTGRLSQVVTEVSHPAFYSTVRAMLIRSGAAEQLARGGGKRPSQWRVLDPDFNFESSKVSGKPPLQQGKDVDRLSELEKMVGGVNVAYAVVDLQRQIDNLRGGPEDERRELGRDGERDTDEG